MAIYEHIRSANFPLAEILETANLASDGDPKNLEILIRRLQSDESIIRYWAGTGLLILGDHAKSAVPQLTKALDDPSIDVAMVAAEALYKLGEKEIGINTLIKALEHPVIPVRTYALNAIEHTGDRSEKVKQAIIAMEKSWGADNPTRVDLRMTGWLKEKWGFK